MAAGCLDGSKTELARRGQTLEIGLSPSRVPPHRTPTFCAGIFATPLPLSIGELPFPSPPTSFIPRPRMCGCHSTLLRSTQCPCCWFLLETSTAAKPPPCPILPGLPPSLRPLLAARSGTECSLLRSSASTNQAIAFDIEVQGRHLATGGQVRKRLLCVHLGRLSAATSLRVPASLLALLLLLPQLLLLCTL